VWRPFNKYEKEIDQGEAWTPKEIWVRFDIGDLIFGASALILVSMGRGTRSCPPDPRLVRWSQLMPRGGAGQHMHYPPQFFAWIEFQLLVVDNHAYARMDFRWDPDLPLPPKEQ